MSLSSDKIVGLLATPDRLCIVAAIVLGARTPSEVVHASGLSESTVTTALTKLIRSGLVRVDRGLFAVDATTFSDAARSAAGTSQPVDFGVSDPKVATVLSAFFVEGRLSTIPAGGRKRTVVLEYLATMFEPGQRYAEPAVNATLAAFHPDTAALRRYLVDEGFLSRADGVYWRSGGWVDVS